MGLFKKEGPKIEINKRTHILTLDNKWHELYRDGKPNNIQQLEKKINVLLQEQGKLTTDLKDYQLLKKKMMNDIVESMGDVNEGNEKNAFKKMSKSKSYIEQINDKIESSEKRLDRIPEEISKVNHELVTLTMKQFYLEMLESKKKSDRLDHEILELRKKIQNMIFARDEATSRYQSLYGYIHDVVGTEIINQYDRYYMPDKVPGQIFKKKHEDQHNENSLPKESDKKND